MTEPDCGACRWSLACRASYLMLGVAIANPAGADTDPIPDYEIPRSA